MKVLVIPEDQTNDQYVVKPVVERIFDELGRKADVHVLPEPRLRGAEDALDIALIRQIVEENPMVDLFVLVVDRDCDRRGHTVRVAQIEALHQRLVGCLAVQETEVWMLALHREEVERESKVKWKEIRSHCDPKEAFANKFLEHLASSGPGSGRKAAMRALSGKWKTLLALCPEIRELRDRIGRALER